mgnify:FL=1|jgi:hypothetical protein
MNSKKNNINFWIFFSGLIFFIIRWYNPLFNFDEKIDIAIIFESISDGFYYFAHFKALANFDLSYSFDSLINNLSNMTVPTGAFYLHFIFYYFLGSWSFVILELVYVLIFLIIFYKISRLLSFLRSESLLIAVILFNIPIFLELLSLDREIYFSVIYSEFYSFRFPRPMISSVFWYAFILCIFRLLNKEFFIKKNFVLLGAISGLSFTSFFHTFVLEQLILVFIFLYIFKNNSLNELKKNFKFIILFLTSFFIICLPFFINMFFSDADFLERNGLVNLDLEKKMILLSYILKKLFKFEFLLIIFFSVLLLTFVNYKKKLINYKKLNIFFIIFYISILSPFIFLMISPKIFSHFYLFNNIIVISSFLLFFFSILSIMKFYAIKIVPIKIISNTAFVIILLTLFTNFYQNQKNYNEIQLTSDSISKRNEFKKITNLIHENKFIDIKKSNLLTFDEKFFVWAILNDIKYLKIINGTLVPKKNFMIENDLINTFKYLGLTKRDFFDFIKNKKISSWRYRNENVKKLFWMRYQANSLITHNNSKNFDKEILDFINQSSPLLSQQLIIPNNEISRLLLKFDNLNNYYDHPDLIIFDKKNDIVANSIINLKIFCKAFDGEHYIFYYKLVNNLNCKNQ